MRHERAKLIHVIQINRSISEELNTIKHCFGTKIAKLSEYKLDQLGLSVTYTYINVILPDQ